MFQSTDFGYYGCGRKTWQSRNIQDSKVHGTNMGPTWILSAPGWAPCWPHKPCYQGLSIICGRTVINHIILSNRKSRDHCLTWWPVSWAFVAKDAIGAMLFIRCGYGCICYYIPDNFDLTQRTRPTRTTQPMAHTLYIAAVAIFISIGESKVFKAVFWIAKWRIK